MTPCVTRLRPRPARVGAAQPRRRTLAPASCLRSSAYAGSRGVDSPSLGHPIQARSASEGMTRCRLKRTGIFRPRPQPPRVTGRFTPLAALRDPPSATSCEGRGCPGPSPDARSRHPALRLLDADSRGVGSPPWATRGNGQASFRSRSGRHRSGPLEGERPREPRPGVGALPSGCGQAGSQAGRARSIRASEASRPRIARQS